MSAAFKISIEDFAGEVRHSHSEKVFQTVNNWSYQSVIFGVIPDDLTSDESETDSWVNQSKLVKDFYEPAEKFTQFVRDGSKRSSISEFLDASGNTYSLETLPKDGTSLSDGHAALLLNRFSKQFRNEVSTGRAATCFETHINYIIGSSSILSKVQRNLILNLCKQVRYRPIPSLFLTHYIIKYLENPQALRAILSASIWNKRRNIQRVLSFAPAVYNDLVESKRQNVAVLFLGFSQSQLLLLKEIAKLCSENGSILKVFIPKSEENFALSSHVIASFIESKNIIVSEVTVENLLPEEIQMTLASSKLCSWSPFGKLNVLTDVGSVKFYKRLAIAGRQMDSTYLPPPIVVTSGLFKFWPGFFRKHYRDSFRDLGEGAVVDNSAILGQRHIYALVTERGLLRRSELEQKSFLSKIDNYSVANRVFFLNNAEKLDELHRKDSAFDAFFGKFLKEKSENSNSDEFLKDACRVIRLLFPESLTETTYKAGEKFEDLNVLSSDMICDFDTASAVARAEVPDFLVKFEKQLLQGFTNRLEESFEEKSMSPEEIHVLARSIGGEFTAKMVPIIGRMPPSTHGPFSADVLFFSRLTQKAAEFYKRNDVQFQDLLDHCEEFVLNRAGGVSYALQVPADAFHI